MEDMEIKERMKIEARMRRVSGTGGLEKLMEKNGWDGTTSFISAASAFKDSGLNNRYLLFMAAQQRWENLGNQLTPEKTIVIMSEEEALELAKKNSKSEDIPSLERGGLGKEERAALGTLLGVMCIYIRQNSDEDNMDVLGELEGEIRTKFKIPSGDPRKEAAEKILIGGIAKIKELI